MDRLVEGVDGQSFELVGVAYLRVQGCNTDERRRVHPKERSGEHEECFGPAPASDREGS